MSNFPTLQTASTAPTLIQVAPGMLWTNVTKPADGAVLAVSGNLSGAQDQRVYGPVPVTVSGTFIGSTIGSSSIMYSTQFVDIAIETSTALVEKVLNTEKAQCDFSVAELTSENVQATLPGAAWNQPIATLSTSADPLQAGQTRHVLTIGGLRLVAPQCIAFISPNRRISLTNPPVSNQAYSYVFCGYNAVSTAGFDAPFSRGKETVWKVDFELIADTARSIGDQILQFTTRQ